MSTQLRIASVIVSLLAASCSGDPGPAGSPLIAGSLRTAGAEDATELPGPAGPQGLAGPQGPQGPAGPQGPPGLATGIVWKDATGKAVERTLFEGNMFHYLDASNHVWTLDRESGTVSPVFSVDRIFYTSDDCSGQAFHYSFPGWPGALLPRYTLVLWYEPTKVLVRPDTATLTTVTICSMKFATMCAPLDCSEMGLIEVVEVPGLAPPDLQLVPPLHPEMP